MLHIDKSQEPDFLCEFKKSYPNKTYESEEFKEYRGKLKDVLIKEQKGLCAYCCSRIKNNNSHNEHIEPQHPGKYNSLRSLDYDNIVASCNRSKTCGTKKDNDYDKEKFVSPIDEDCEKIFDYGLDGKIEGDNYTIDLLGLNDYELVHARKATIRMIQDMDKDMIEQIYMNPDEKEYWPYYNVIKWYWKSL